MRISSDQIYMRGLNGMLTQQERLAKAQERVYSGKRVSSAADDPVAAAQITLLRQRLARTEQFQDNTGSAETSIAYEESVLKNTESIISELKTLQVKAGNGALSDEDRKSLAVSAQKLLEELVSVSNSMDSSGNNYLFSGSKTSTKPFTMDSSGHYIYNGDDTQRYTMISNNFQVAVSDPGSDLFSRLKNGNGYFSVNLPATPNTGNTVLTTGAVSDITAYVEDTYTLSFANNTSGQLVVMVSGAASGNVMPPTGNVDDAPLYKDGQSLSFNGIEISASGTPKPGDSFTLAPTQNQSIFTTVQAMIDNLNQSTENSAQRAVVQTNNNRLLVELDTGLNNILQYRAQLGGRLQQLDLATEINLNMTTNDTTMKDQLELADPYQAYTEMTQQMMSLQAAQMSFTKIQGMSLLNFL